MTGRILVAGVCAVFFLGISAQAATATPTQEQKAALTKAVNDFNLVNRQMRNMNVVRDGQAVLGKLDGVEKTLFDAGWQRTDAQADKVFKAVDDARGRLKAAMEKHGVSSSSEPAAAAKLRYDQQRSLSDAKLNLRNVEAGLDNARQTAEALKAGKNVPQNDMETATNSLTAANKSMDKVRKNIKQLPASHPDVKPVYDAAVKAEDTLKEYTDIVMGKVKDVGQEMRKLVDDVADDYARLSRMAQAYREASDKKFMDYVSKYDYPKYRQLWIDAAMAQGHANEMKKKYAVFADKHGGMAETGKKVLNSADDVQKYAPIFVDNITAAMAKDITNVNDAMDSVKDEAKYAVDNKKPAHFAGGIPQKMNEIADHITQLEQAPVVPHKTGDLRKRYNELVADIDRQKADMEAEIIAEVKLPADEYKGSDRNEVEKMIRDEWAQKYPNEKIELIRFHSPVWYVTREWRWDDGNKAWVWYDRAVLPVKVVVKNADGKTANIYMAFCNRDNVNKTMNAGVETRDGYVVETILMENVK